MLLSGDGAVPGILLAYSGTSVLLRIAASGRQRIDLDAKPEATVLLLAVCASLLTGLLAGLVPALRAMGRSGETGFGRLCGRSLVAIQVALSLVLLIEKDAHGNVQLSGSGALADLLCEEVKSKLGHQARARRHVRLSAALFVGCVSGVDQKGAQEGNIGEKAVQYAMQGHEYRFGRHQARRELCGRLFPDSAEFGGGKDPCDGR